MERCSVLNTLSPKTGQYLFAVKNLKTSRRYLPFVCCHNPLTSILLYSLRKLFTGLEPAALSA